MLTTYTDFAAWEKDAQDEMKQDIPLLIGTVGDGTIYRAFILLRMSRGKMLSEPAKEFYGEFDITENKGVLADSPEEFLTHVNEQHKLQQRQ